VKKVNDAIQSEGHASTKEEFDELYEIACAPFKRHGPKDKKSPKKRRRD